MIATYATAGHPIICGELEGYLVVPTATFTALNIPELETRTMRRPMPGRPRGIDRTESQTLLLNLRIGEHTGERAARLVRYGVERIVLVSGDALDSVLLAIGLLDGVEVGATVEIVSWRIEDPTPQPSKVELLLRDQS